MWSVPLPPWRPWPSFWELAWHGAESDRSKTGSSTCSPLAGPGWRRRCDRYLAGRHGQSHRRARQPALRAGVGDTAAGDETATNTDTIILVRVPNNGKSATAISIPRDSYVAAPGLGKTKINGVYGQVREEKRVSLVESGVPETEAEARGTEAGREALIKTVADLTGVTVDHYAEIGLLGFALITDALGGVDVCLKEPVYEPLSGADFPAGWQKLNGRRR
ncbi:cell envelope-related function transcriptional attenuator common domain protein [Mycobacterium xenopi 4042]|uniref:Cell envelope-related function transcriptional attenuator common domain protein n=1 Tax=Mycobacterium xenopi 4042 TaxID=1299334 RepID=X7YJR7_MYCXE|nr:cell envelope-related function transcriptional attenuator common domain protein [Mycobacterium xenopi 4042]